MTGDFHPKTHRITFDFPTFDFSIMITTSRWVWTFVEQPHHLP